EAGTLEPLGENKTRSPIAPAPLPGGAMQARIEMNHGKSLLPLVLAAVGLGLVGCGQSVTASSSLNTLPPVVLFSPISSTSVYLMNLDGQLLNEWRTDQAPGYSVYLLPSGLLLRAKSVPERPFSTLQGSNGGRVEMLDWNGNVVWGFDYASLEGQQHHDVFWMPNSGHVLMVAWERRTAPQAIPAGRTPQTPPDDGGLRGAQIVPGEP